MRKIILMSLLTVTIFVSFSFAFADETNATDKVEKKTDDEKQAETLTIISKLEQKSGLPKFTMSSMDSMFCRAKMNVIRTFGNIEVVRPENLISPILGKIFYNNKEYHFIISCEKKGGNHTLLYFDKNADKNLTDETVIKASTNYSRNEPVYEYVNYEMFEIPIGESKVSVMLRYTLSEYVQKNTEKKIRNEYFQYAILQQFTGKLKLAEKEYNFVIVDQKADKKFDFGSNDFELWFIDVNGDGKYDITYNNPEIVSSTEFMLGGYEIKVHFDMQKMTATFTGSKPETGYIKLGIEGATDACVYVAKSASHWGQQYKVEFKDGVGLAPCGKLLLRQLEFTKDGKRNKVMYRTYTRKDKVEISKDKPYELKLNLMFKVNAYPGTEKEGRKQYTIMGYVFDKRMYNKEEYLTRVQLFQNDKEVKPCDFLINNSKGNEVSKGVGYFC